MLLALLGAGRLLEGVGKSLFRQLLDPAKEPFLVGFFDWKDRYDVVFGVGLVAL